MALQLQDGLRPTVENLEYIEHKDDLCKIENVYNGSKTAAVYLQPFVKELEESIIQRLDNLTLLNFTSRAINTAKNMIFRKEMLIFSDGSEIANEYNDEERKALDDLAKEVTRLVLRDGHVYLVIDAPEADETVKTRADEIALGITPNLYEVERKRVPNWSYNKDKSYSHITINEDYYISEGFAQYIKEQQRVFYEDRVEIWRDNELYDTIPTSIGYVPVVKIGMDDLHFLDLCKINLRHMNRSSHLDKYLTVAAVPIPVFYGVEAGADIIVGVDTAFNFRDKDSGGFEFVEMSGQSTTILQEDLLKLEQDMSTFIASLNSPNDVAKNETQVNAETFEADSFLTSVSKEVQDGLNNALLMYTDMGGKNVLVQINTDFNSNVIDASQVSQYLSLYREGIISHETFLEILITGEVLPADTDVNQEIGAVMAVKEESDTADVNKIAQTAEAVAAVTKE